MRWSIEAIGPDTQRKSGSISEKMDARSPSNAFRESIIFFVPALMGYDLAASLSHAATTSGMSASASYRTSRDFR